jgi:predicted dehydrogenase
MRLGLLSTARINDEILAAAAASDEVEVVAVASRNGARAADYAREHGIARAHGSYDDLLADGEVDAVYVSLPNGFHHEWSMKALAAGKHVLCEKPYSRRPDEVGEAFDRAEQGALVLMEGFMYRHNSQTERVAELVSGGAIGRLRHVRATFTFVLSDTTDVRLRPELEGGALMDVGCYCVSGSRLLAGEPERVLGEQVLAETGVDLAFHGTMRFPGDVVSQFDASFTVPRDQRLEVVGEEGTLVVEAPWRVDWGGDVLLRRGGEVERIDVPAGDSYRLELENLAAAITGRAPARLGRDDALGQARAIDALYRSAAESRAVEL